MSALHIQFESYLKNELKVSGKTLRNYRADLGHFLRWSKDHLGKKDLVVEDLESLLPHFSPYLVATYKTHHVQKGVPQATINRRLSTLRNFGKFLASSGHTKHNPAQLITNIKEELSHEEKLHGVVREFAKHLEKEGASRRTQINYLSDVRHLTAWLIKQEDWIKEPTSTAKRGQQEIQSG